ADRVQERATRSWPLLGGSHGRPRGHHRPRRCDEDAREDDHAGHAVGRTEVPHRGRSIQDVVRSRQSLTGGVRMLARFVMCRVLVVLIVLAGAISPALAAQDGTMTWGIHVTLVSRWLDPGDTEALITPFMVLYALHDA